MEVKVEQKTEASSIDFTKNQLLISKDSPLVILSNGHTEVLDGIRYFSGTVLRGEYEVVGTYIPRCRQKGFEIFKGKITIEQ